MKKIIALPFLLLCFFSAIAQSPQAIPYQAVLRNADGSVIANQAVTITFTIHNNAVDGTTEYQENHNTTSNALGLINLNVGQGTPTIGTFSAINWGSGTKFLQVAMNNGNGNIDLGTQQMLSVPYALHSSSSDNAVNAINATNATNATNAVNAQTAANGFSSVSTTGDTLYMANGTFIIVPGISVANFPPAILGCTDNAACNYNSSATQNDNSCLYLNATCDDGNANTFNDIINSSCVCAGTQTGGSGTGAQLLPGNATCSTQNISVTGCGGQTTLTYDGRTYDLVEIGGQCWFADNLATDQYRNGDPIPTGLSNTTWQNTTAGAYAIYNNDLANDATYGKLYNWYTIVDSRGLCPTGWHVPTDCEWMYLEGSLGMTIQQQEGIDWRGTNEGGALKATTGWTSPNTGATNSSGFNAFSGGYRFPQGTYDYMGNYGFWWSSSAFESGNVRIRILGFANSNVLRGPSNSYQVGLSVRCVRD